MSRFTSHAGLPPVAASSGTSAGLADTRPEAGGIDGRAPTGATPSAPLPSAPSRRRHGSARRASALVLVLIMTGVLGLVCASMLARTTQDNRISRMSQAQLELKSALDGIVDYACAQISSRAGFASTDAPDTFTRTGKTPLAPLPANALPGVGADRSLLVLENQELLCSQVKPLSSGNPTYLDKFYINPNVPLNANDPLRDQRVNRSIVVVAVKAQARRPGGGDPMTAYQACVLERRDSFYFNYCANFGANDIQFRGLKGSINFSGPVFSNNDIAIAHSSLTKALTFGGTVYAAGEFTASGGPGSTTYKIGPGSTQYSLVNAETGRLWTQSDANFKDGVTNATSGYLQSGVHGVQRSTDGGPTAPVTDPVSGRTLYDPATKTVYDATGAKFYALDENRVIDGAHATILTRHASAESAALAAESAAHNSPGDTSLAAAAASARALANALAVGAANEKAKVARKASVYALVESNGELTVFNNPADATDYKALAPASRAAWRSANPGKLLQVADAVALPTLETNRTAADGAPLRDLPRRTIYDKMQNATVTLVDVDLGKLKGLIETPGAIRYANGTVWNPADTTTNVSRTASTNVHPDSTAGWNGLLYVDVEQPLGRLPGKYVDSATGQPVLKNGADRETIGTLNWNVTTPTGNDAGGITAVRIKNGGSVPGARTNSSGGFSLATNSPLYVQGNLNADGSMAGDSQAPEPGEVPAALWADHVTALSGDFDDLALYLPPAATVSAADKANWPFKTVAETGVARELTYQNVPRQNVEFACGVVAGDTLTPGAVSTTRVDTAAGKIYTYTRGSANVGTSNGIQNFVNYLQRFDPNTQVFRVRGSLVNPFKNRYFQGTYSAGSYFNNPVRDFGFASLFAQGRMPPGADAIRSYRKVRCFEITAAEFERLRASTTIEHWIGKDTGVLGRH